MTAGYNLHHIPARKPRALIACEFSGVVRDAFTRHGFDAMSCDLLPSERPGPHHEGDIFDVIGIGWDIMIAHPPCTYLANSGVRWLFDKDKDGQRVINMERMSNLFNAAWFFRKLLQTGIPHVAIENPIMHKYGIAGVGCKQDQVVQPWMFGHPESKATCFWLQNLPLLEPTNVVEGRDQRVWKMPPSDDRWKDRSRTYEGIAEAMAVQWGGYVRESKPWLT